MHHLSQGEDSLDWQREVGVKAISNLGTPFSLPLVRDIMFGRKKCSKDLILMAIYTLGSDKLSKHVSSHTRDEVNKNFERNLVLLNQIEIIDHDNVK